MRLARLFDASAWARRQAGNVDVVGGRREVGKPGVL